MGAGKLSVGTIVGGLYVVEQFLGAGAMGEVYRAREIAISASGATPREPARVALKVLHRHLASDPGIIERFRREARIAAKIQSPYVAEVRLAKIESEGRHWIAFELLRGESLDDYLRRETTMPFDEVARLLDNVLEGLVAAHAHDIVHRDLKPSNLFLDGDGGTWTRARILDFGVSKISGTVAPGTPLTGMDTIVGSLSFMPPEQIRSSSGVDARADLYTLGIIVSKCLTGEIPFRARTIGELTELKQHVDALTLFEQTGTTWPPALEAFQRQMLALDREERFASATAALRAWRTTCRHVQRDAGFDATARWRAPGGDRHDDAATDTQILSAGSTTSST